LGASDVIAVVAAPNYETPGQIVLEKIQRALGLEAAETRILVEV
jgi:hypothetical protein